MLILLEIPHTNGIILSDRTWVNHMNAGQVSLGSSWPESSWPGYIGLILLLPSIFIPGARMRCVLYIKMFKKKFEGLMFGTFYIVGLSILFHLTGPTS